MHNKTVVFPEAITQMLQKYIYQAKAQQIFKIHFVAHWKKTWIRNFFYTKFGHNIFLWVRRRYRVISYFVEDAFVYTRFNLVGWWISNITFGIILLYSLSVFPVSCKVTKKFYQFWNITRIYTNRRHPPTLEARCEILKWDCHLPSVLDSTWWRQMCYGLITGTLISFKLNPK